MYFTIDANIEYANKSNKKHTHTNKFVGKIKKIQGTTSAGNRKLCNFSSWSESMRVNKYLHGSFDCV